MPPLTGDLAALAPARAVLNHVAPSAPDCVRGSFLPAKDSVPFLDAQQPLLGCIPEDGDSELPLAYEKLCKRYEVLVEQLGSLKSSLVRDACLNTLQTRMPLFLRHAGLHIESINKSSDGAGRVVGKLRSTLALAAAVQVLDTIESAMASEAREVLEEKLAMVASKASSQAAACFHVSHWVVPALVFDLRAGAAAFASVEGDKHDSLPLELTVEPILSFGADELLSGSVRDRTIGMYDIEIVECKHSPQGFAAGAGALGVAFVKVRVSKRNETCKGIRVWGEEDIDVLKLKAARA